MMSGNNDNGCIQCGRKIMPSISNRCMYCGADLPEEHHLDAEQKSQLLADKLAQFKHNEENAHNIVSSMRRDYGIPDPKKSRKQRKEDNAAALAAALSDVTQHTEGKN